MENFTYFNPTRIHFGRGQIASVDSEVPAGARVLLLAGGGSIRTNGVHTQVRKALGKRFVAEFFGVEANPDYDTLMKAVELVRREKLDFILSVGGGSVADGAKFVAAAVPFKGDPWEILLTRGSAVASALPIGVVLTLPGTGSEANMASVISRRSVKEKLAFLNPNVFPRFAVLDPETTDRQRRRRRVHPRDRAVHDLSGPCRAPGPVRRVGDAGAGRGGNKVREEPHRL